MTRLRDVAERARVSVPTGSAYVSDALRQSVLLEHPLITIAQSSYIMGQRACELLLRLVHGETDLSYEESHPRLPTELIIRESCRGVTRLSHGEDKALTRRPVKQGA